MGKQFGYLSAPWTGADLIAAIRKMATDPTIGWEAISDGSKRAGFNAWSQVSDPGVAGQDFMCPDPARSRFLYTYGDKVYAVPVVNGAPQPSVQLLSGLPTGSMWMPWVVGNTLYLAQFLGTGFRQVPINPDGSLGTPTTPTASAPGSFYSLASVGGRLFAVANSYNRIYEAQLGPGGNVVGWTQVLDMSASGAAPSSYEPVLLSDGTRLYYLEIRYNNPARIWGIPVRPQGLGVPFGGTQFPNYAYRNSSRAPFGAAPGVLVFPYAHTTNNVYLAQLAANGAVESILTVASATPGSPAAAGAGAMLPSGLFLLKYGTTLYYALIRETGSAVVLNAYTGFGRDKYLYLRVPAGSGGLEAYLAEAWDVATDTATNLTRIASPSLSTGQDLILTLIGAPTHLGFLFRQGSTLPLPILVGEVEPHLRPDGTLVYPQDDGSWPLFFGVHSWAYSLNNERGLGITTLRGPIRPEWFVLGDAYHSSFYVMTHTSFLAGPPPSFGGPSPMPPTTAKRGRVYQRLSPSATPSSNEPGLDRGWLGVGDTILFARDTTGAEGDVVELPTGRYTILHRRRDDYGFYDLLVQEEAAVLEVM